LEREEREQRRQQDAEAELTPEEWAEQEAGTVLAAAVQAMDATYSFAQV
jgi:hypothetical protein